MGYLCNLNEKPFLSENVLPFSKECDILGLFPETNTKGALIMSIPSITVPSHMNQQVFTDFSNFNSFRLHNRWLGLAGFPVLMIALSVVNRETGSDFLFYLFIACGIGLPLLYLLFYFVSLKQQVKANGLDTPRLAYTVTLSPHGVEVETDKEHAKYRWEQLYRVYVLPEATYVYITRARAFLLPHADLSDGVTPQELVALVSEHLPAVRLFDKRGRAARGNGQ